MLVMYQDDLHSYLYFQSLQERSIKVRCKELEGG
jgi:hypothetical protein